MASSEQTPSLRRRVSTVRHKVGWHVRFANQIEEIVPGSGPARQNYVARLLILPDVHFGRVKPELSRQTNRLAAAVLKQLGGAGHAPPFLIYTMVYYGRRGGDSCWREKKPGRTVVRRGPIALAQT